MTAVGILFLLITGFALLACKLRQILIRDFDCESLTVQMIAALFVLVTCVVPIIILFYCLVKTVGDL